MAAMSVACASASSRSPYQPTRPMQPKPSAETRSPVLPRGRVCIRIAFLSLCVTLRGVLTEGQTISEPLRRVPERGIKLPPMLRGHVPVLSVGRCTASLFASVASLFGSATLRATEDQIEQGARLYARTCAICHGQNAVGGTKDLRHMTPDTHKEFNDIVLGGKRVQKGMASFADILSKEDADAIHAFVTARANED